MWVIAKRTTIGTLKPGDSASIDLLPDPIPVKNNGGRMTQNETDYIKFKLR
jgi:hypothetical protein